MRFSVALFTAALVALAGVESGQAAQSPVKSPSQSSGQPPRAEPGPRACLSDPLAARVTPTATLDTRPRADGAARYGSMQYRGPSPLQPMQVALTFDDGPSANTRQVLDVLDRHCIKATFFLVGWYAQAHPELVREIAARGHTLGTHTWLHPVSLRKLGDARAERQITQGFVAVQAALSDAPPDQRARLAPFFRFPGLNDSQPMIRWLGERQIAVVSADFRARTTGSRSAPPRSSAAP